MVLALLLDEPSAALSLAGFIAAQYTFEVMNDIVGPVTRASVLEAFRRRRGIDVGGYPVTFACGRRSDSFVTQSMLAPDARAIG